MKKLKVAIFDLTDCEGCEVRLLSMEKTLLKFAKSVEIINWRLVKGKNEIGFYDLTFIEGTVITPAEEKLVKALREQSKMIIALGACACIGGVSTSSNDKNRKKLVEYVYDKNYRPLSKNAKPLSAYIKVDYFFNGCPVHTKEIKEWLPQLLLKTVIKPKNYKVCFQCKAEGNECLLIKGEPCLGPITLGGCGAACPSSGIICRGCWGSCRDANFPAIITALKHQGRKPTEIKKILSIFFNHKSFYTNKHK